jgi:hypothetical protein
VRSVRLRFRMLIRAPVSTAHWPGPFLLKQDASERPPTLKIRIPSQKKRKQFSENTPEDVETDTNFQTHRPKKSRESRPKDSKRSRGRPRKSDSEKAVFEVSVFIEVAQEPEIVRGKTKRGDKLIQKDPLRFGPCTVNQETAWLEFLEMIAATGHTRRENLALPSLTWRFLKNGKANNGLPLTNESAFKTMGDQILGWKEKSGGVILVSMAKPVVISQLPV